MNFLVSGPPMSDDAKLPAEMLSEPSDARFSMRAVLITTSVLSVVAAIGGTYLHRFPRDVQLRLMILWIVWLLAIVVWTGVAFWMRLRAEQLAGKKLLRLSLTLPQKISWTGFSHVVLMPFVAVLFLGIVTARIAETPIPAAGLSWIMDFGFPFVLSIASSAGVAPYLLWQREACFCRNGILWNQTLLLWSELIKHEWTGPNDDILEIYGLDAPNRRPVLKIPVTRENRETVRQILIASQQGEIRLEGADEGLDSLPLYRVFSTSHVRSHLVYVCISIVAGIGLLAYAYWNSTGISDFDIAAMCGLYIQLISMTWARHRSRRLAGTPIVRLFARRDLRGLVATVAAALVLYECAMRLTLTSQWLCYVIAAIYGTLTFRAISYFFLTKLDLRSNGVVVPGILFWPWTEVSVSSNRTNRDCEQLVLRRGLRRIIARVPPEQREAINRVLTENLGR